MQWTENTPHNIRMEFKQNKIKPHKKQQFKQLNNNKKTTYNRKIW